MCQPEATQPEIVVIGAGAAGLLAAARAAELGRQVLLLEKNRRPGVKILMSGGTRCNITHATDRRGIASAFGPSERFLHAPLAALGPEELVALIEAEGVQTKVEPTGKVFPVSNKAADVLAALLRRLERSGADLSLKEPVLTLERDSAAFRIVTSAREIRAPKVILTSGGRSYPGSGTTGDGEAWVARLGHRIVPARPALVPLTTSAAWVRELMGVTLADVRVQVVDGQTVLAERRGGFLFAHFGLSGPAVLDVSRSVTAHPAPSLLRLRFDFVPDMAPGELSQAIVECTARDSRRQALAVLGEAISSRAGGPADLPKRLFEALAVLADVPPGRRASELSREERQRLIQNLKFCEIPLTGALGFEKAEVTAGGVALDEVRSKDLQSRKTPGLYLAGEILDLDGPIGGYNFQAAFSTGWLAGESAALAFEGDRGA